MKWVYRIVAALSIYMGVVLLYGAFATHIPVLDLFMAFFGMMLVGMGMLIVKRK